MEDEREREEEKNIMPKQIHLIVFVKNKNTLVIYLTFSFFNKKTALPFSHMPPQKSPVLQSQRYTAPERKKDRNNCVIE